MKNIFLFLFLTCIGIACNTKNTDGTGDSLSANDTTSTGNAQAGNIIITLFVDLDFLNEDNLEDHIRIKDSNNSESRGRGVKNHETKIEKNNKIIWRVKPEKSSTRKSIEIVDITTKKTDQPFRLIKDVRRNNGGNLIQADVKNVQDTTIVDCYNIHFNVIDENGEKTELKVDPKLRMRHFIQ